MKRLWVVLIWTAMMGSVASAQSSNFYIFGGIGTGGSSNNRISMGGLGYEHVFRKTVGVAGEIGGIGSGFGGFAVFSANGYAHLTPGKDSRLDPFVTGGYSAAVEEGSANMFNFGGGVNYWLHRRFGLRLEIRDHVFIDSVAHYWGFRFGLGVR